MPERPTREEVDDLIVRTREAHEVLKDIKTATRELRDTIKDAEVAQVALMAAVVSMVDHGIEAAVETGLENYNDAIDKAIVTAEDAIYRRFDAIAAILLGETGGDFEDAARLVRKSLDREEHLTSVEGWQMEEMQKTLHRRLEVESLREKGEK